MRRFLLIILFFATLCVDSSAQQPKREMRGVWIATVANIDWPKVMTLDSAAQKAEMIALLDRAKAFNLNTVVFQIRPTSDALYRSAYEPWSHWITGVQGQAPKYDPLQFVIEECDKRGLAVHVWINPYRVWLDKSNVNKATDASHPYNRMKDKLITYGNSIYLNPALDETRRYVCGVVADIVENYDIDAIHMDDYFYPYRIHGQEFPDEADFRRNPRGFSDKEDWRRNNVNLIVKDIHDTIKAVKPWVEFGISPFGVWRNKSKDPRGSDTRGGQTNYDDLYADVLLWTREGWVDYILPQIYWHIGFNLADYKTLAEWWNDNTNGTPTYIGHGSYRIDPKSRTKEWQSPYEIVRQVSLNRSLENITGSVMYSANSLTSDAFRKAMTNEKFSTPALLPENPKITPIVPETPSGLSIEYHNGKTILSWTPELDDRRFVIYRFSSKDAENFENSENIVAVTGLTEYVIEQPKSATSKYRYALTALSLTNRESMPAFF